MTSARSTASKRSYAALWVKCRPDTSSSRWKPVPITFLPPLSLTAPTTRKKTRRRKRKIKTRKKRKRTARKKTNRHPKFEIRNSKSETNPKSKKENPKLEPFPFRIFLLGDSDLFRISDFDIRIWVFLR